MYTLVIKDQGSCRVRSLGCNSFQVCLLEEPITVVANTLLFGTRRLALLCLLRDTTTLKDPTFVRHPGS